MLVAEERLNANGGVETFIYYIYDANGIAGLFVNNAYYYFTKNLFGDIIGIKNEANELVGAYTYNAWGECTVKTNVDGIATLNPFRYRGYYYDTETGFYYLQTRYYDPTICRFISADDPEILGDLSSVVGQFNLYAYCLNNPVMYTDPSGLFVLTATATAVGYFVAAILLIMAVVLTVDLINQLDIDIIDLFTVDTQVVADALSDIVVAYQRKPAAPRIKNNSKKRAYDAAKRKGGGKEPRHDPHGHKGNPRLHYHPNVDGPIGHWHYYYPAVLIASGTYGIDICIENISVKELYIVPYVI